MHNEIIGENMASQKLSQTGLRWLWITVIAIFIDRITKVYIQTVFLPYEQLQVTPFFNLTLAFNKGAAFSFLNSAAGWQTWFFGVLAVLISIGLLVWLFKLPASKPLAPVAISLVIGGALGNLWDRISYGHVIDFLDFHIQAWHWPVFNCADSFICIGAFLLMLDAFKK